MQLSKKKNDSNYQTQRVETKKSARHRVKESAGRSSTVLKDELDRLKALYGSNVQKQAPGPSLLAEFTKNHFKISTSTRNKGINRGFTKKASVSSNGVNGLPQNWTNGPQASNPELELDKNNTYSMRNRPTSHYMATNYLLDGVNSKNGQFVRLKEQIQEYQKKMVELNNVAVKSLVTQTRPRSAKRRPPSVNRCKSTTPQKGKRA